MMSIILTEGLGFTDNADIVKVDELKFKIEIPTLTFTIRDIDRLSFNVTIPTYNFSIDTPITRFNIKEQVVKFKVEEV